MIRLRTAVTGTTLALAFVINPACYETLTYSPHWEFGEAEMRAAVEGTWELRYDATGEIIRFTVAQSSRAQMAMAPRPGLIASAHACNNTRSLIKTASACEAVSMMPLDVIAEGHHVERALLYLTGTEFDDQDPDRQKFLFTIDGIRVRSAVFRNDRAGWRWAMASEGERNVSVALRRVPR